MTSKYSAIITRTKLIYEEAFIEIEVDNDEDVIEEILQKYDVEDCLADWEEDDYEYDKMQGLEVKNIKCLD